MRPVSLVVGVGPCETLEELLAGAVGLAVRERARRPVLELGFLCSGRSGRVLSISWGKATGRRKTHCFERSTPG